VCELAHRTRSRVVTPQMRYVHNHLILRANHLLSCQRVFSLFYAPDEKSAAAIAEFKIGEDRRRRLVVREQD
jgi:hypothetical protein